MPKFSKVSAQRLATCDERLQRILNEAIKHRDFAVLCGHRNQMDQEQAYADGKSRAHFPMSKHNSNPSRAVDIAPWPIDWNDRIGFRDLANFILGVAAGMGIKLKWGGTFKTLVDLPHFELAEP